MRTECKVSMRVKLDSNQWKIIGVNLEHNHELAPSKWLVRFMQCHKSMTPAEKKFIEILQNSRVPPRKVMSIFRMLRTHVRAVGFDARDVTNLKSQENKKHRNKDVDELLTLFKDRQKRIPGFYYSLQTDEDGTVRSVFWTDAVGRSNYKVYGEYISFDTTFSTNVYDMPFAPIVGVDNHGKTILFGCGLLKDQTAESFEWLFDTFLAANDGKMPKTIMTDQDQAIAIALNSKFPYSVRRFCYWHIIKVMKQKQYAYFKARKGLYREIKRAVKHSFTPSEFEQRWHEVLTKYNATDNNRLNYLYNIRRYWVPAYFMNCFYPFSSTTGRSESTNAMFKGYVAHKDTIVNFFAAYENIQEKSLSSLDRCRFDSELKKPNQWSYNCLEEDASKIYTNAIFRKIQKEFRNSTAYGVAEIINGRLYEVKRKTEYKDPEFHKDLFTVEVADNKKEFSCTCGKLDRDGIHCCHVLKIAERLDLLVLPESFVKYRWTKRADQDVSLATGQDLVVGGSKASESIQYCIMMADIANYCSSIAGDKKAVTLFAAEFEKLKAKITEEMKKNAEGNAQTNPENTIGGQGSPAGSNQENEPARETPIYKDPPRVIKKKSNTKRKIPIGEKVENQMRAQEAKKNKVKKAPTVKRCSECKSTTHDKKSCPEIGKMLQLPQVILFVQKLIIQLYVLVDHILFWSVEAKYILICFFENM